MKGRSRLSLLLLAAMLTGRLAFAGPDNLGVTLPGGDPIQNFPPLMKSRTRTFVLPLLKPNSSSPGLGWGTTALIAAPAAVGIYDYAQYGGYGGTLGVAGPVYVAGSLFGTFMMMHSMSGMQQYVNPSYLPAQAPGQSSVTLTLWDNSLVDADALYLSEKDVVGDASQVEGYRQSLLARYPVQNEIIIEATVTNGGFAPLNLAPFAWHLYLVGPGGQRCKAIGYDSSLDQPLQPGETVTGKVFFPPVDPVTHADLESNGVQGILEDVGGKTFRFSFR